MLFRSDSRTLNKWIAEHKWDRLRAQKSVNKGTVRIKLLTLMDASLEKAIQNEEFNAFSKEAMGFAKLLEQLEDEPIAQMAVAIFPLFRELLQNQQKHDPTITPDFIKKVDSLMDIFVKNNL